MVVSCAAYNCKNRFKKTATYSFHSFPKDETMNKKWVIAMGRKNYTPSSHAKICSEHFQPSDFIAKIGLKKLKADAIPSVFKFPSHVIKPEEPLIQPESSSNIVENNMAIISPTSQIVKEESPTQVGKFSLGIVKEEIPTNQVEEFDSCTVKEESPNQVEKLCSCIVQEEGTNRVEKFCSCIVEEETANQVEKLCSSVILEEISNQVEKFGSCIVKEETPNQVERLSSSIVQEESPNEVEKYSRIVKKESPHQILTLCSCVTTGATNTVTEITKTKRKRHNAIYVGDFDEEDLHDFRKATLMFDMARGVIERQKKTIKYLRTKNQRLDRKISKLQGLLNDKKNGTHIQ